jgi:hypothetical protein
MELLRALASVMAPPDAAVARVAATLELPASPTPPEHAFLFQSQLPPLASLYLSANGEAGGDARDRIAGYWRAVGETPPSEPDHLLHMLAFYADLVEQEERESDESRRHAVARIRRVFYCEQLLAWLPGYVTKVDLIASRTYRRWGQLLEQVVAREAWRAAAQSCLPGTLRRLQELGEPPAGDADVLLTYLVAPARSGLILAPVDLERAADELHVAAPRGSVRQGLASLFGMRQGPLLNWLAAEAKRWEARHERNRGLLPALSDHWTRRARATRALLLAWMRGEEVSAPAGTAAGQAALPARRLGRPRGVVRGPTRM